MKKEAERDKTDEEEYEKDAVKIAIKTLVKYFKAKYPQTKWDQFVVTEADLKKENPSEEVLNRVVKVIQDSNPQEEKEPICKEWKMYYKYKTEPYKTDLCIPKKSFGIFVREISQDYLTDVKWEEEALEALQHAAEQFLVEVFENAREIEKYHDDPHYLYGYLPKKLIR
jgi:histone H3/H4